MGLRGIFVVEIEGRPKQKVNSNLILEDITRKVRMVDPKVEWDWKNFAGIHDIMTWKGVPRDLGKAQQILKYLETTIKRYYLSLRISIKIQLEEGEGVVDAES